MNNKLLSMLLISIFMVSSVSASHFVVGGIEDTKKGVSPNGLEVLLWNKDKTEYLADIVGPEGNAKSSNVYMFNCELFNEPCKPGDVLTIELINAKNRKKTAKATVTITPFSYNLVDILRPKKIKL